MFSYTITCGDKYLCLCLWIASAQLSMLTFPLDGLPKTMVLMSIIGDCGCESPRERKPREYENKRT